MAKHSINLDGVQECLDAERLPQMIGMWLADCRARLPAYTVDGYEDKISYFLFWWSGVAQWKRHELSAADLHLFARWLSNTTTSQRQPLSRNSQRDVLRRLRQCLRWAFQRRFVAVDVSAWVPMAPPVLVQRRVATVEELRQLLAAGGQAADPLRDQAAIALLMQTGMRLGELCSIRVESIRLMADWSGTLRVTGKRTSANPTGERTVAFDRFAGSYLAPFLDARGGDAGPLLRNESGRALTPRTVQRILDRARQRAGLTDVSLSPHALRRAFITHFRRNNRGEELDNILRKQVGHASPAVTAIYDLIDESDLVDVIRGPLC